MAQWASGQQFGRRSRPDSGGDVDFTSLIDVVFLLLIFFMYSIAVSDQSEVDVPAAKLGSAVDPDDAIIVTILADDVAQPVPQFHLGEVSADKGTIDDVRHYLDQARRTGKSHVLIKAEKLVPHKHVLAVARLVGEMEAGQLVIAIEEAPL